MPGPQTLGDKIREARRARLWSQQTLAEKLGTQRQRIILWEKNRHAPHTHYQRLLADVLGLRPSDFAAPKTEIELRLEALEERLNVRAAEVAERRSA